MVPEEAVSGFEGLVRSRERAEEWCAGGWNTTCNFSAHTISAGSSGTAAPGRGPGPGSSSIQPSNGRQLLRQGHIRLGVARHDGTFLFRS